MPNVGATPVFPDPNLPAPLGSARQEWYRAVDLSLPFAQLQAEHAKNLSAVLVVGMVGCGCYGPGSGRARTSR